MAVENTTKATGQVSPPTAQAPKPGTSSTKAAATPAKKRKSTPPLDLSGVKTTVVTNSSLMAQGRRQRGERPEAQKKVDKIVEDAWNAWTVAGKPSEWTKMPGTRLEVPTAQYEPLVYAIRRAGTFYNLKIRFGNAVEDKATGTTEVIFVATDRPEDKPSKTANPAATSASASGQQTAGGPKTAEQAVNGTGQTEA